jgi:hypothetical protein
MISSYPSRSLPLTLHVCPCCSLLPGQNLVERHGSEAPLGGLFKKTFFRYMRSMPGGGSERCSREMRDRAFSFCQVPKACELVGEGGRGLEFEGAGAADMGSPEKRVVSDLDLGTPSPRPREADSDPADTRSGESADRDQQSRGEGGGEGYTKFFEFALHSAVNSLQGNLRSSSGSGGGQLQLEDIFGADLPDVEACGMFVCGVVCCGVQPDENHKMRRVRHEDWCGDVITKQRGVLRINCIDCLDRTNIAMSLIARSTLVRQLEYMGVLSEAEASAMSSTDASCFPQVQESVVGVWANHGDVLSLQYAGSQALQSDVTRTGRRTLQGLLSDSVTSVQRYVQRSLYDNSTQEMLEWLLGEQEPARPHNAPVHREHRSAADREPCLSAQRSPGAQGPQPDRAPPGGLSMPSGLPKPGAAGVGTDVRGIYSSVPLDGQVAAARSGGSRGEGVASNSAEGSDVPSCPHAGLPEQQGKSSVQHWLELATGWGGGQMSGTGRWYNSMLSPRTSEPANNEGLEVGARVSGDYDDDEWELLYGSLSDPVL